MGGGQKDQEMKKEGDGGKKEESQSLPVMGRNIQYDSAKWEEIMKQEEQEEEEAAKADAPVVAKVLALEQFKEVCAQYKTLKDAPEEKKGELKETKEKMESYITKQLEELSPLKLDVEPASKGKLLEVLMTVEKELAWKDYFKADGADLFPVLFKHTFYGKDI